MDVHKWILAFEALAYNFVHAWISRSMISYSTEVIMKWKHGFGLLVDWDLEDVEIVLA